MQIIQFRRQETKDIVPFTYNFCLLAGEMRLSCFQQSGFLLSGLKVSTCSNSDNDDKPQPLLSAPEGH